MHTVTSKIAGLSAALFVVSMAHTSEAFTWGRLASDLGQQYIVARDETPGNQCASLVQENLEAYTIVSDAWGNVTESAHVWGQAAKDLLMANLMPYEIEDDGYQTCSKMYDVDVTLKFASGSSSYTHTSVVEWFYRLPIPENSLRIWLTKRSVCTGHFNYHASMGTGGPWGSWGIYANYYKSY